MKFITWNVRGLNGSHKMEVVKNLGRDHKHDILVIQEITISKDKAIFLEVFKNCGQAVGSAEGASGGTLILWNEAYIFGTTFMENKKIYYG